MPEYRPPRFAHWQAPRGLALAFNGCERRGGQPYAEIPLWLPASMGNLNMPIERALTAGLRHRDVDETLRDTRVWAESLDGAVGQIDAGGRVRRPTAMTPERETELLERWRARVA